VIRTQIQLTEEQARRIRALAKREGISMAEAIRRCVERALDAERADVSDLYERAAKLAGSFDDPEGAADVSAEHDRYLDDAFGARR